MVGQGVDGHAGVRELAARSQAVRLPRMITGAQIRNFRCLADVDLTLEPLTILVGPNASGKSAILTALQPGPYDGRDARYGGAIDIRFSWDGGAMVSRASIGYHVQLLHLDLDRMRAGNEVREEKILLTDGSNLSNVFATLTRSQQSTLVERLTTLVPMYRDVVARPGNPGQHRLVFQDHWNPSAWYEPWQVSDGTILLLAFLLIQYQSNAPNVLAIEEPERGLHPYLVGELVRMLRQLAKGELGPKSIQVILATHSAELLEFADPHEVRFVSRRETDGTTQVESAPTASADWANAVKEYQGSLGGLWLSGALGGVPGG